MAMNWSKERYVRVYTRNTPSWNIAPWEARCFLLNLLRELDREGRIDLGVDGIHALAATLRAPLEAVEGPLKYWLERGTITLHDNILAMPHFVAAQEAAASGALRQQKYSEKIKNSDAAVTYTDAELTAVTPSLAVPSLAVPSLAVPNLTNTTTSLLLEPTAPEPKKAKGPRKPKVQKPEKTPCPGSIAPDIDQWCKDHGIPTQSEEPRVTKFLDTKRGSGWLSVDWAAEWRAWTQSPFYAASKAQQMASVNNQPKKGYLQDTPTDVYWGKGATMESIAEHNRKQRELDEAERASSDNKTKDRMDLWPSLTTSSQK